MTLIPQSWLPDCKMARIIVHWTAGAYMVSSTDREHYHIIVGGDGVLVRGNNSIIANVSTRDADGYAAHTLGLNTGSIGISAACMAGAIEKPFKAGVYPLREGQWVRLMQIAAELCKKYEIHVTPKTVLQHGEVQRQLGIDQKGKWDICVLPWSPTSTSEEVCDEFRRGVIQKL